MAFRATFPGTDPDALTMAKYDDMVELIPTVQLWQAGKDVRHDLATRRANREVVIRDAFGHPIAATTGDPDDLGG